MTFFDADFLGVLRVKGNGYTLMKGNSVNSFCFPSEKRSTLKGRNLLPLGANFFLLEKTPFQKGIGVLESKQEVMKVMAL